MVSVRGSLSPAQVESMMAITWEGQMRVAQP